MSTDKEKIEEEIKVLQNEQKEYFIKELDIFGYVQSLDFKYKFESLNPDVCVNCGREYRVTHWCDVENIQIWSPNWKKILYPLYASFVDSKNRIAYDKIIRDEELQKKKVTEWERSKNDPNTKYVIDPIKMNSKPIQIGKKRKSIKTGVWCWCFGFLSIGIIMFLVFGLPKI